MRDYLYSILSPFRDGHTRRVACPECGGRDTFTATVYGDAVIYNCYRAGCDAQGRYNVRLSTEEKLSYLKRKWEAEQEERPFECPDYWIDGVGNDLCVDYMRRTHMMEVYEKGGFRPMYDPAERRFVFPIKEDGKVVGGIGRSLIGGYPKTNNYNEHYTKPFTCGKGSIALLVEDCASAVAASRSPDVTGVALLGTNVRSDFILSMTNYKWVGIALDPDAYNKSLRLKTKLSPYLKDVRVLKLPNDVKDLSNISFLDFLYANGVSSV